MRRNLIIGGVLALTAAFGVWLWARNGLAVWIDAAIAFCS